MKKLYYYTYAFISVLCLALISLSACYSVNSPNKKPPKAIKGVLDLTDWDFEKDGMVKLNGEWELYWEQFMFPKDFKEKKLPEMTGFIKDNYLWNRYKVNGRNLPGTGYATYRLTVKLKKSDGDFGIILPYIISAYQIWIDDKMISGIGRPGKKEETATSKCAVNVILFNQNKSSIQIIVQISNFLFTNYGGIFSPLLFGNKDQILYKWTYSVASELFVLGSIFIMALYHFGLYLLRRKDISALFFGLFCLLIFMRHALLGNLGYLLYPYFLVDIRNKIVLLGFYMGSIIFFSYLKELFPFEFSKKIFRLFLIISIIYILIVLFTPTRIFWNTITSFDIITVLMMLYILCALSKAILSKRDGAIWVVSGFLILTITIANDILYDNEIIETAYIVFLGIFCFIFSQSFVLSVRFSKAFVEVENLEEKYRNIFENAIEGFFQTTIDGRFLSANPSMASIHGFKSSHDMISSVQNVGQDLYVDPDDRVRFTDMIRNKNRVQEFEAQFYRKDKSTFWGSVTARVVKDNQGKILYYEGTLIDITERKQTEKLKDEFLSNTSHELRTPLNGIIGLAESLIDGVTGKLQEGTKKNLSMIVQSGKRLANLVNDILDFSKLKNKDLQLKRNPVDFRQLTEIVIYLSKPLAADKLLELKNNIPHDIPLVTGDENRLQQIMYNLIGNAVKFTEQGSVSVNARVENDKIKISVSDTGIGIPKDKHKVIFNSFEQADGSIEREYGGTGLGLAVTKSLVELHGGEIWVESEKGRGSTFYFTLPVSDDVSQTEEDKRVISIDRSFVHEKISTLKRDDLPALTDNKSDPITMSMYGDFENATVLVVDDEYVNLQVILNNLMLSGAKGIAASSGNEAIEILKQYRPDIVFLDIMMPVINGYETARKIRELYSKEELPIIFISAKNMTQDIVDGFSAGGNDYITKPISKSELFARTSFHIGLLKSRSALKETEEKYRNIFENAIEGIFQSLPSGQFLTVNPAFAKMLLYDSPKDLMNSIINIEDQLYANIEDRGKFKQIIKECREIINFETQFFCKDGSILWGSLSVRETHDKKGIKYYEGSLINISDRKEKEMAEKQKEIALATTLAKSEFLARMSHEIRTPMNAILGMADLLSETPLSALQKDYVKIFQSSGELLLSIINDILDFSKIEANQIQLEQIPFDLIELVNDISSILSFRANEKGLLLSCRIEPDVHSVVIGDPTRLKQIFMNLLGNAIKFTAQGEVALEVSFSPDSNDSECLQFCVKDTGIGIPPEKQSMLFQSFSQVDASTTRKYGGTGLGLAIAKRLVELMGGKIWIESEANKGTKFFITLKLLHGEKSQLLSANVFVQANDKALVPMQILYAEDSDANRKVLQMYLADTPLQIDTAVNGKEAFDRFISKRFDLVLMDMEMPVMDGYEATQKIRKWEQENQKAETPIIALTAHVFGEYHKRCIDAGCNRFLTKPIKKKILIQTIVDVTLNISRDNSIVSDSEQSNEDLNKARLNDYSDGRYHVQVSSALEEIMPFLFSEIEEEMEGIQKSLQGNDFETMNRLSHSLKGASRNYELNDLAEIFLLIENASEEKNKDKILDGLQKVTDYLEKLEIEYI